MPIKSGIGFGEAQVYNQPNAITSLYGKLLQQQAKDQAQFATDLNNVMSKYSTKGLREGDIKLTSEAYQQLKDKVTSSSARTPAERAQALAEARNGIQTIQEYADTALNAYKSLDQFAPDVAANPWKYQPGTKEVIEQLYKNPYAKWGDNYKELNPTTFHRQADESAIYKMFNNVNSDLAKIAPKFKANDITDGKHIKTIYNVPEADAYSNLYTTMELTPEAKYTLTAKFQQDNPDKTDFTPADVAAYGLNLYKKLYGDNALQFFGGRTLIPKETGSGTPDWLNNPNPVTLNIPYASGKASVNGQNYIALSLPNKNFAGSNAIDLTTGSPVKSLKSSNDYQVVGIANFPTIASGKLAGSLAQPNYESNNQNNISYQPYIHVQQAVKVGSKTITKDLLVPFDRLPQNVKSSKILQKIIGNFRPSSGAPKGNSGSGKGNTDPLNILNP
jgi:hypothetical protein